jgi:lipid-binding SYLF domain-containing protein
MHSLRSNRLPLILAAASIVSMSVTNQANSATADDLDKDSRQALQTLYWEVGVGPTVVVVDAGVAKNLSTSSLKDDAYAFIFSRQGLMAGVSIEGTKISRIDR